MLLLKAGDMWAFVTNHETSLPTQREIIDEFRSLSAQRIVYNSKENAMIASNLICHPGRQMKYPSTVFYKSKMCQLPKASCKIPHEILRKRLAPGSWLLAPGSWIVTYQDIRIKSPSGSSEGVWAAFSPGSWAIPSPSSFFLIPT